jgi:hypothetical protein
MLPTGKKAITPFSYSGITKPFCRCWCFSPTVGLWLIQHPQDPMLPTGKKAITPYSYSGITKSFCFFVPF